MNKHYLYTNIGLVLLLSLIMTWGYLQYRQNIFDNNIKCHEAGYHLQKFSNVITGYYNLRENICYITFDNREDIRIDAMSFSGVNERKKLKDSINKINSGVLDK